MFRAPIRMIVCLTSGNPWNFLVKRGEMIDNFE